jgi:hypothetical protein
MRKPIKPAAVEVWGIAAGRGTTKEAARGAFTFREYKDIEECEKVKGDWLEIVCIRERAGRKEEMT